MHNELCKTIHDDVYFKPNKKCTQQIRTKIEHTYYENGFFFSFNEIISLCTHICVSCSGPEWMMFALPAK